MSKLKSISSLLSGFVRVHNNLVLYSSNYLLTDIRNNPNDDSRVKLISGSGSGHEPAHIGYVGSGMLTTCVCGELYSSPSVQNILGAILITGTPTTNILLITKNYTGGRLNFGLAIEQARYRYNYKNIDLVIINDDISIDDDKVQESVGRRGLAGTIFYHKIIGAMAAEQQSLHQIVDFVNRFLTQNKICTVGFTFSTKIQNEIRNIEIGKGIHGEPGIEFIDKLENFDTIYMNMLKKFEKKIHPNSIVVLMVNNLGGTSEFTMNIVLGEIIQKFSEFYKIVKIYMGSFLSSLNSEGISVTLINLSNPTDLEHIISYLGYKTSVPWNIFELNDKHEKSVKSVVKTNIPRRQEPPQDKSFKSKFPNASDAILFKRIVARCAHDLIVNTTLLNTIDAEYGDSDTGSGLSRFGNQIERNMKNGSIKSFDNPKLILMQLGKVAQNVGGTIGAIYCLFFQALSSSINDGATIDLRHWSIGIRLGVATITKYGRSKKDDRTLLEPLIACAEALENFNGIDNVRKMCEQSIARTQNLIPKAGRAAYTFSMRQKSNERSIANYPDPGAKAIGIIVGAITDEINNFK